MAPLSKYNRSRLQNLESIGSGLGASIVRGTKHVLNGGHSVPTLIYRYGHLTSKVTIPDGLQASGLLVVAYIYWLGLTPFSKVRTK